MEQQCSVIISHFQFSSLTVLFRISLNFVDFELSLRHCQRLLKNLKKTKEDDREDGVLGNKTRDECPHENVMKTGKNKPECCLI